MYLQQHERLNAQWKDRTQDNVIVERQRAGFISYVKLERVRSQLEFGSKERLLVSFYVAYLRYTAAEAEL